MLFVIGAQAAVIRAAELGRALQGERAIARFDVVLAAFPIGRIGRNQRPVHPVALAILLIPNLVVANFDLGRHQGQAGLAQ
jgi:hypothetical protein